MVVAYINEITKLKFNFMKLTNLNPVAKLNSLYIFIL